MQEFRFKSARGRFLLSAWYQKKKGSLHELGLRDRFRAAKRSFSDLLGRHADSAFLPAFRLEEPNRNACAAFMNTLLVKNEEIRAAGCLVDPVLEMHGTLEAVCRLEGTV